VRLRDEPCDGTVCGLSLQHHQHHSRGSHKVAAHAAQHVLSMALPTLLIFIRPDLGLTYTQAGILAAASSMTGGIMQLPAGLLADRFGSKRVLVTGFVFSLTGLSGQSLAMLLLAQVIVGIGNSTFHPASFPAVAEASKRTGLGMGMALHNIGGTVGGAISYSLVAVLASWLGWRIALRSMVVVGAILAAYFTYAYIEPSELGSVAAYFTYAYIEPSELGSAPSNSDNNEVDQDGAKAEDDLPAETHHKPWQAANRSTIQQWIPVVVIAVAAFLSGSFGEGLMTFLPTFFADSRGATAVVAGMLSTLMMVSGTVGAFLGGKAADKVDRSMLVLGGAVVTTVLIVLLVSTHLNALGLGLILILVGASRALTRPPFHAITSEVAPHGQSGSVFGLIFAGSFLGGSVGNPLVGYIADHASLQVAFAVIATFYLVHGLLIRYLGWRNMTGASQQKPGLRAYRSVTHR